MSELPTWIYNIAPGPIFYRRSLSVEDNNIVTKLDKIDYELGSAIDDLELVKEALREMEDYSHADLVRGTQGRLARLRRKDHQASKELVREQARKWFLTSKKGISS